MAIVIKKSRFFRTICCLLSFLLVQTSLESVQAQPTPFFPAGHYFVDLSTPYSLPVLRGMRVYPAKPFEFDFVVDSGSHLAIDQKETSILIKYFLTCLTIPEEDLWVNLSPYESGRIIPDELALTDAGNDLLRQDKFLKQLASSLTYPESELGKKFWDQVYKRAYAKFGTTNLPVNTYNKVWIVPDKAIVYDMGNSALIGETHLKVMLEEDYLATKNHTAPKGEAASIAHQISAGITRDLILPQLEKEVNEGKNFAKVRQVFHSLILAAWFKRALKRNVLNNFYVDKRKIAGIDDVDKGAKDAIYKQYLRIYKVGAYNYIREDVDPLTQQVVPRKYFSGGLNFGKTDLAMKTLQVPSFDAIRGKLDAAQLSAAHDYGVAKVELLPIGGDMAQLMNNPVLRPDAAQLPLSPALLKSLSGKFAVAVALAIPLIAVAHGTTFAQAVPQHTITHYSATGGQVFATPRQGSTLSQIVLDIMNAQNPELSNVNRRQELYQKLPSYLAQLNVTRNTPILENRRMNITALVSDQKAIAFLVGEAVLRSPLAAAPPPREEPPRQVVVPGGSPPIARGPVPPPPEPVPVPPPPPASQAPPVADLPAAPAAPAALPAPQIAADTAAAQARADAFEAVRTTAMLQHAQIMREARLTAQRAADKAADDARLERTRRAQLAADALRDQRAQALERQRIAREAEIARKAKQDAEIAQAAAARAERLRKAEETRKAQAERQRQLADQRKKAQAERQQRLADQRNRARTATVAAPPPPPPPAPIEPRTDQGDLRTTQTTPTDKPRNAPTPVASPRGDNPGPGSLNVAGDAPNVQFIPAPEEPRPMPEPPPPNGDGPSLVGSARAAIVIPPMGMEPGRPAAPWLTQRRDGNAQALQPAVFGRTIPNEGSSVTLVAGGPPEAGSQHIDIPDHRTLTQLTLQILPRLTGQVYDLHPEIMHYAKNSVIFRINNFEVRRQIKILEGRTEEARQAWRKAEVDFRNQSLSAEKLTQYRENFQKLSRELAEKKIEAELGVVRAPYDLDIESWGGLNDGVYITDKDLQRSDTDHNAERHVVRYHPTSDRFSVELEIPRGITYFGNLNLTLDDQNRQNQVDVKSYFDPILREQTVGDLEHRKNFLRLHITLPERSPIRLGDPVGLSMEVRPPDRRDALNFSGIDGIPRITGLVLGTFKFPITAMVPGKVTYFVKQGDFVKAGQRMSHVETKPYEDQLAAVKAALIDVRQRKAVMAPQGSIVYSEVPEMLELDSREREFLAQKEMLEELIRSADTFAPEDLRVLSTGEDESDNIQMGGILFTYAPDVVELGTNDVGIDDKYHIFADIRRNIENGDLVVVKTLDGVPLLGEVIDHRPAQHSKTVMSSEQSLVVMVYDPQHILRKDWGFGVFLLTPEVQRAIKSQPGYVPPSQRKHIAQRAVPYLDNAAPPPPPAPPLTPPRRAGGRPPGGGARAATLAAATLPSPAGSPTAQPANQAFPILQNPPIRITLRAPNSFQGFRLSPEAATDAVLAYRLNGGRTEVDMFKAAASEGLPAAVTVSLFGGISSNGKFNYGISGSYGGFNLAVTRGSSLGSSIPAAVQATGNLISALDGEVDQKVDSNATTTKVKYYDWVTALLKQSYETNRFLIELAAVQDEILLSRGLKIDLEKALAQMKGRLTSTPTLQIEQSQGNIDNVDGEIARLETLAQKLMRPINALTGKGWEHLEDPLVSTVNLSQRMVPIAGNDKQAFIAKILSAQSLNTRLQSVLTAQRGVERDIRIQGLEFYPKLNGTGLLGTADLSNAQYNIIPGATSISSVIHKIFGVLSGELPIYDGTARIKRKVLALDAQASLDDIERTRIAIAQEAGDTIDEYNSLVRDQIPKAEQELAHAQNALILAGHRDVAADLASYRLKITEKAKKVAELRAKAREDLVYLYLLDPPTYPVRNANMLQERTDKAQLSHLRKRILSMAGVIFISLSILPSTFWGQGVPNSAQQQWATQQREGQQNMLENYRRQAIEGETLQARIAALDSIYAEFSNDPRFISALKYITFHSSKVDVVQEIFRRMAWGDKPNLHFLIEINEEAKLELVNDKDRLLDLTALVYLYIEDILMDHPDIFKGKSILSFVPNANSPYPMVTPEAVRRVIRTETAWRLGTIHMDRFLQNSLPPPFSPDRSPQQPFMSPILWAQDLNALNTYVFTLQNDQKPVPQGQRIENLMNTERSQVERSIELDLVPEIWHKGPFNPNLLWIFPFEERNRERLTGWGEDAKGFLETSPNWEAPEFKDPTLLGRSLPRTSNFIARVPPGTAIQGEPIDDLSRLPSMEGASIIYYEMNEAPEKAGYIARSGPSEVVRLLKYLKYVPGNTLEENMKDPAFRLKLLSAYRYADDDFQDLIESKLDIYDLWNDAHRNDAAWKRVLRESLTMVYNRHAQNPKENPDQLKKVAPLMDVVLETMSASELSRYKDPRPDGDLRVRAQMERIGYRWAAQEIFASQEFRQSPITAREGRYHDEELDLPQIMDIVNTTIDPLMMQRTVAEIRQNVPREGWQEMVTRMFNQVVFDWEIPHSYAEMIERFSSEMRHFAYDIDIGYQGLYFPRIPLFALGTYLGIGIFTFVILFSRIMWFYNRFLVPLGGHRRLLRSFRQEYRTDEQSIEESADQAMVSITRNNTYVGVYQPLHNWNEKQLWLRRQGRLTPDQFFNAFNEIIEYAGKALHIMKYDPDLILKEDGVSLLNEYHNKGYNRLIALCQDTFEGFDTLYQRMDMEGLSEERKDWVRRSVMNDKNTLMKINLIANQFQYILSNIGGVDVPMGEKLHNSHFLERIRLSTLARRVQRTQRMLNVSRRRILDENRGLPLLLRMTNDLMPGFYKAPQDEDYYLFSEDDFDLPGPSESGDPRYQGLSENQIVLQRMWDLIARIRAGGISVPEPDKDVKVPIEILNDLMTGQNILGQGDSLLSERERLGLKRQFLEEHFQAPPRVDIFQESRARLERKIVRGSTAFTSTSLAGRVDRRLSTQLRHILTVLGIFVFGGIIVMSLLGRVQTHIAFITGIIPSALAYYFYWRPNNKQINLYWYRNLVLGTKKLDRHLNRILDPDGRYRVMDERIENALAAQGITQPSQIQDAIIEDMAREDSRISEQEEVNAENPEFDGLIIIAETEAEARRLQGLVDIIQNKSEIGHDPQRKINRRIPVFVRHPGARASGNAFLKTEQEVRDYFDSPGFRADNPGLKSWDDSKYGVLIHDSAPDPGNERFLGGLQRLYRGRKLVPVGGQFIVLDEKPNHSPVQNIPGSPFTVHATRTNRRGLLGSMWVHTESSENGSYTVQEMKEKMDIQKMLFELLIQPRGEKTINEMRRKGYATGNRNALQFKSFADGVIVDGETVDMLISLADRSDDLDTLNVRFGGDLLAVLALALFYRDNPSYQTEEIRLLAEKRVDKRQEDYQALVADYQRWYNMIVDRVNNFSRVKMNAIVPHIGVDGFRTHYTHPSEAMISPGRPHREGGIDLNFKPQFIQRPSSESGLPAREEIMARMPVGFRGFNFNIVRLTTQLTVSGAFQLMLNSH